MLISEQYTHGGAGLNWYSDPTSTAAIWVVKKDAVPIAGKGAGPGFVWIRSGSVTYFSCYLTPNEPIEDFERKLVGLEDEIRGVRGEVLVGGDFNAKAVEWGAPAPDSRGRRVMDMVARLSLVILNEGDVSTFRRAGYTGTIPDITMGSERLAGQVQDWQVLEDYSASDHQYIQLKIGENLPKQVVNPPPRWNVERLDKEILDIMLQWGKGALHKLKNEARGGLLAASLVGATMRLLTRACASSMPQKKAVRNRQPAYWWTTEIANLRGNCLRLRRLAQRSRRNTPDFHLKTEQYRAARQALKIAIGRSKANKWKELCDDVESDPWGLGYKLVLQKLKGCDTTAEMPTEVKERIVGELFPTHELEEQTLVEVAPGEIPLFTREELQRAAKSMRNKKAPGPDRIPVEILKIVARNRPEVLLDMYNASLTEGIFPRQWKVANLVLTSKGKGDPSTAAAHRPLCMLDTAGKLYEKLLKQRMLDAVAEAGGLSPRQYGFTTGKSTVDAINEVVTSAKAVRTGNHSSRDLCMIVTLDVRNAFNSAKWSDILKAVKEDFQVPAYLYNVLQSYLSERWVTFDTRDGRRQKRITAGAAQGSVLGADLWNVNYDGIFHIKMPDGVRLVGYADDVVIIIVARNEEFLQFKLNQAMRRIVEWMESKSLSLAVQKTEIVLLTTRRIDRGITMHVGDQIIAVSEAVRYLGVMLDTKLTFWTHICKVADKAAKVVAQLSRLMANVGGPSPGKRKLLMRTAETIMLYGAEVWAEALRFQKYRRRMEAVQRRGALRICSAYRTVSGPAAQIIAGVIPIDMLADERRRVYIRKGENAPRVVRKEERERTLNGWQNRWDQEPKGRWTAKLINNIRVWIERKHGEVGYYLTQFLTGHGYFRSYLKKIGKSTDTKCLYCQNDEEDDVKHTFFVCGRWQHFRDDLVLSIGEPTPETIVAKMTQTEGNWEAISTFVTLVLKEKERTRDWE